MKICAGFDNAYEGICRFVELQNITVRYYN